MVAKVSDFGMSRLLGDGATSNTTATAVGPIRWMVRRQILTTALFKFDKLTEEFLFFRSLCKIQAPESIGSMSYSFASDVWMTGVAIWEIFNEKTPHESINMIDLAVTIRDTGITPQGWPEGTPKAIIKMVKTMMLIKDPAERSTMKQCVEYLEKKFPEEDSDDSGDQ